METQTLPAAPLRPRTLVVGTAFVTGSVVMFFAGLFAIYFSMRSDTKAWGSEWYPEGAIQLSPGSMNMATLTISVVTMAWAVYSVRNNDRIHAYLALALTAVMGIAMINQTAFYLNDIALPIDYSPTTTLLFTIVGAHVVMVVVGVLWLVVLLLRALGGQDSSQHIPLFSSAAVYWYAMVAIYSVIWIGIYIGK
tara:strand:- start:83 stop:664 length:582 start_codon:yes stop_codon:yes gene_type:complete